MELPSIENLVSSSNIKINGSNMGNDSTGYNVPLDDAFEIIAAIIVEETAIPIFPKKNAIAKSNRLLITKDSNKI